MTRFATESARINRRHIRAEAAVWIARFHGPERTPALEDGLRRWLAEDPRHAAEFELATDVWNESVPLAKGATPARVKASRIVIPTHLLKPFLAAASACLLMITAWLIHVSGGFALSTGTGEQETVVLADGSRITLNTNTRIVLRHGKHTRTVRLDYGEAYFAVVHNGSLPFIVRADGHRVVDLGTKFIVSSNEASDDSLTVTVIEGRVAVASLNHTHTRSPLLSHDVNIVTAGQRLKLPPHAPPAISSEPLDVATAWLRGDLIFDGTPLSDAATQFNRYNSSKITITSPEVGRIPVGGVFKFRDSISFARAVAASHHLRLIISGGHLVLLPEGSYIQNSPSPLPQH